MKWLRSLSAQSWLTNFRATIFRGLLRGFDHHTPDMVKRTQLQILLNATAKGFQVKPIRVWHMRAQDALKAYGNFTKTCMAVVRESGDEVGDVHSEYGCSNVKHLNANQLYKIAYKLGTRLRKMTGFKEPEDLKNLVFFLYKNIGITMTGLLPGELFVTECYFSNIYSPNECMCMSAMDSGIISGIFGGGDLTFASRITEGCTGCRVIFQGENKNES